MIVHIVVLKFRDENKEENIKRVKEMLNRLTQKIDALVSMEVGINFDRAQRAYDLSLYAKFETKEDLQTYATHEEHLKVVAVIKEVTSDSKVVDYII